MGRAEDGRRPESDDTHEQGDLTVSETAVRCHRLVELFLQIEDETTQEICIRFVEEMVATKMT